ncbi:MAG: YbfB/YjiJ family MFS transporter [Limnohabitans sp.]|jgi:predicted MFS family arabinose efflux permease|nr:YbfB/YjiJ family MFS transporter [Limnohabitans sp.]
MSRPHTPGSRLWGQALILSLGAAVSLGVTRFAYGLLLPPMRESLEWSYTLAGAMNTANAAGYLLGALLMPRLLRRWPPGAVLRMGMALAALFMALSGFVTDAGMLMVQRLLAGWASALVFVTGGLLAARLAQQRPQQGGWLIGLYYGGTGWGIVVSTWVVPWVLTVPHDWPRAWWVLACTCALALMALWRTVGQLDQQQGQAAVTRSEGAIRFELSQWLFGLAGYACFGMGYIGYMTFVIALLRAQGASGSSITVFYSALGLAVVLSARLWARLLDHFKGGQALAILNALLALATVVPALAAPAWALGLSGLLFGAVFLSVVASTTAMVRHNLPADEWARGISAFTIVFAVGQIIGPTLVGWVADGPGGLTRGLACSAAVLLLGAVLAWRQRPLAHPAAGKQGVD